MKRVISHQSNSEHYKADACIVWCFDDRFSSLLEQFIRESKFQHADLVKIAGGAKGLTSPADPFERQYVLDQIGKSIALHHTPKVILMAHSECGAYGKQFADRKDEESFYQKELAKAVDAVKSFMKNRYPETRVLSYFADFDGLMK